MEAVERALAAGIQNKKRTPCLCVCLYAGANINAKDAYTLRLCVSVCVCVCVCECVCGVVCVYMQEQT